MLDDIEERFAAGGRTPKGCRARRAIFHATRRTVGEVGLHDASLDAIAERAGLTQAALRHHFPTRDELLSAFFTTASDWFREQMAGLLALEALPARDKLERCIGWHLEYMEAVDTVFWLEASAFWLRQSRVRKVRDDWYRWLLGQYSGLIAQVQPGLSASERQRRAFAVLTLILGAWVTHGRGSTVAAKVPAAGRRQLLLDTALDLALQ